VSWLAVHKHASVEILLSSEEMGRTYDGNKGVGVMFRVGAYGGLVLNVVNFINAAKRHRDMLRAKAR